MQMHHNVKQHFTIHSHIYNFIKREMKHAQIIFNIFLMSEGQIKTLLTEQKC